VQCPRSLQCRRSFVLPRRGRLYGKENLSIDRPDLATRMRFAALRSSKLKDGACVGSHGAVARKRWLRIRDALTSVQRAVKRHLPNVLTCFKRCITNAGSDPFNAVVQMRKKRPADTATSALPCSATYLKPPR
jgi:hypothetical protein